MKKLTRIVGLQKSEFDSYVNDKAVNQKHQILVRPSRLIPILKPGDEMALTSIIKRTRCYWFSDCHEKASGAVH